MRDREQASENVSHGSPVTEEASRAHLARVVSSPPFKRSPRMQALLTFLVEEALAGRGHLIKEYIIATSVFGKPADFDPSTSAVVRVEAGRLRRLLAQYRGENSLQDKLELTIPKGSYAPIFNAASTSGDQEAPTVATDSLLTDPGTSAWNAPAENRVVTVLSCALADDRSATLAGAGDFLAAFDTFFSLCSEIAQRNGGAVDGASSDRLVIYFGWPDVIEDAAGRALTAALELMSVARNALGCVGRGIQIGVASSEVAVRPTTHGTLPAPGIVGRAPSLATKLLGHAPFNGILVSETTRRLTGSSFEFVVTRATGEDADLTPLWRLLRARPEVTRFQAVVTGHSSPLIGRVEELALLTSRWRLSEESEGQAVLLTGDPGMGKSRLAEAFVVSVGSVPVVRRVQCSPHHSNTALFPWIDFVRAEVGIAAQADTTEMEIRRFLEKRGLHGKNEFELVASLLSFAPDEREHDLSRSRQKDLTLALLKRVVFSAGAGQPLLLLVEDIHWADPTSVEFLHELLRDLSAVNVMLLLTSRLDALTTNFRETIITTVRLSRLSKAQCLALVDGMSGSAPLPDASRFMIMDKAEGIPLFVEEITRLALAGGSEQSGAQPVPERLADVLTGQFSKLGSARAVAQVASVIGREFSSTMLCTLAGDLAGRVDASLDQLVAAGVVVRQAGTGRSGEYAFRHALLRDAAYASLLPSARRELHGRVAELVLETFPDLASERPEIVASHFSDGGLPGEALPFWLDAGHKAARSYAMSEAAALLRRAMQTLTLLPASRDRSDLELQILISLGSAIRSMRGYVDDELLAIYGSARTLALELERPEALANAVYGLWTHAAGRGDWPASSRLADEFQTLTNTAVHDSQYDVEAARLLGASAAFRGQFGAAREHFERAMRVYDDGLHGPAFGFDPGASSAAYLSWTFWHLGEFELADKAAHRALEIAEAKQHPSTLAMVLSWLAFHAMCDANPDRIHELNSRLQSVCAERECRYWQPFGIAASAWASFQIEPREDHLSSFLRNVEAFHEQYLKSCLYLLGARMAARLGRIDQGLELVDLARAFLDDHDERIWEAEVYRIRAELCLQAAAAPVADIELLVRRAFDVAVMQGAVPFENRAAAMLASIAADQTSGFDQDSDGLPV